MSLFINENPSPVDHKQNRLMQLAALFLLIYALALSLAPAVRLHSWQVEYRWNHWIGFAVWLVGAAFVHRQTISRLPERDPYLLPIGALLSGWGLLSIWRLDAVMGARQTVWLAICLLVFAVGLRPKNLLGFLRQYKYLWLTGGLLLTGLTFIFGTYPGGVGPRLWLGCCGVYLQPSEPLKLLLIAYLAAYLAGQMPVSFSLVHLLTPTLILFGTALALLIAQRDLGTASLFILIYTVVVYLASQRRRMIVISMVSLLAAGVTGYLLFDVVRIRVDSWIAPWNDPSGRAYQIVQSLIAVAAGGILGRGPGLGSPGIVPVAHSDFVFASVAEETGLLGAVGMLALFGLLVGRGFRAALRAPNNYQRYLAAGITAYLVLQAIFITGGNLRLLPLTGVTLPFVSYGGSSLLTAYVSLLLLVLVSSAGEEEPAPLNRPAPYLVISGALMLGLAALALVTGWWATARRDLLLARPENPRRVINDRFVPRGALLDRNSQPLAMTQGEPGSYQRLYPYPPLAGAVGYNSATNGQAGLEAGLDDYLRGLRGLPASNILWQELLYGQPPPGLDVRLTLDLELQKQADTLMEGKTGALVLINARSGEILALASHPYFDPNTLSDTWLNLLQDPSAPLLNRATQGQYPPGGAIGPFMLAYAAAREGIPQLPDTSVLIIDDVRWECAGNLPPPQTTGEKIGRGCPPALAALGEAIGEDALIDLYERLGFYTGPGLPLLAAVPSAPGIDRREMAAIGQDRLAVTPLQMALAAASLSGGGTMPNPQLAAAVLTPRQGWISVPNENGRDALQADGVQAAVRALTPQDSSYWQATALARTSDETITWYLAGTTTEWAGTPIALALVLEESNASLAEEIGQALLDLAIR